MRLEAVAVGHHHKTWMGDCSEASGSVWSYHFNDNKQLAHDYYVFSADLYHVTAASIAFLFASQCFLYFFYRVKKMYFIARTETKALPRVNPFELKNVAFCLQDDKKQALKIEANTRGKRRK